MIEPKRNNVVDVMCEAFNAHIDRCPDCFHAHQSPTHELSLCRVGEELNNMASAAAGEEWLRQAGEKARAAR